VGSLASAGALGLITPPSITVIVYGVAAEVAIAQLALLWLGIFIATAVVLICVFAQIWTFLPAQMRP
jgi:TRAP-type C4-dicarboxylate transport system permease large subunit